MGDQSKNGSVEINEMDSKEAAELMKWYSGERTGYVRLGPKGYLMPLKYKGMADQLYNWPLRDDDVFIVTFPRSGERTGYVRLGPKGYLMPLKYKGMADQLYNWPLRDDDVFIVTFPRSGTTLTQELMWLVANNLDYETAGRITLTRRFPFIEYLSMIHPEFEKELFAKNSHIPENITFLKSHLESRTVRNMTRMPSPRFIKTHMPLSLLPPTLLDKTKVVYVARDPRDVVVSYYFLCKQMNVFGFTGDLKDFWALFIKNLVYVSPFFEHLKEAWDLRHHPNMLFLFYEDLVKDLRSSIQRVCKLFDKQYSEQEIQKLCEHLSYENFRKNKSVNLSYSIIGFISETLQFVRKGNSGGWRDQFDEKMTLEADRWMEENLRDTDMRFPQHN